jgi:hypothetical protein
MSRDETETGRAAKTVKRAGLEGERGVVVVEGMASSGAGAFDDTVGDIVPGSSMLVNRSRRVVLVTDRHVYVFRGRRYDRPGKRLGVFPVGPQAMSFDGSKVRLPDESAIYVSVYQAQKLAHAAGVDLRAAVIADLLERVGDPDEQTILLTQGLDPSTTRRTMIDRISDLTDGDIGQILGGKNATTTSDGCIVLVTATKTYIFAGDRVWDPGRLIGTYGVGPESVLRDGATVEFPDGRTVVFDDADSAQHVVDACRGSVV